MSESGSDEKITDATDGRRCATEDKIRVLRDAAGVNILEVC